MSAVSASRSVAVEAGAPTILLPKGIIVEVGAPGDRTLRRLSVVKRWPRFEGTASRVLFEDEHGRPTALTDEEIAILCRQGRFRVVFDAEGRAVTPRPTLLDLSPEQLAHCQWRRAFVDAFFARPDPGSRSRADVGPKIALTYAKVGGDKVPCYQSVLNWVDVWEEQGELFPLECLHFPSNAGNRDWKVESKLVDEMVDVGVRHALALPKGTAEDARGFAAAALKIRLEALGRTDLLGHEKLALALLGTRIEGKAIIPEVTMPTLRTFQRRMKDVDAFLRDASRFGERRGRRKHARTYERPLPELPLSEVECDHTPCDVIVVDDTRKVIFGRPDLIAFRDRATGAFLGVSIGFEAPSFASFVNGLRHAMYPKDMSEYPGLRRWPMFGRPTRLYVDKAMHFVGNDIERTSAALGFEIREFLPAEPSLKGGMERLIGVVNAAMHKLPGATFSNAEERKKYEDVAGKPTVTIARLRAFVTSWITERHNPEPHQGLGFLKRLKGIPEVLWDEKIGQVEMAPLPQEETFVWLAGDSRRCHVTRDGGVYWDHIQYQSIALAAITGQAGHKAGRDKRDWQGREHEGSKYLVRRDPFDIGHVYVTNPFDGGRAIKVPATRMDYAGGLTRHQHDIIRANAEADLRRAADRDPVDVLMRARKEVDRYVELLFQQRRLEHHDKRLARWLERGRRQQEASTVSRPAFSPDLSADFLDPTDPAGIHPPPPESIDTVAATAAGPAAAGTERDTFDTAEPLPEHVDRGAKVAAGIKARGAAAEAKAEAERRPRPDADPLTPEDLEAIRERRGFGTIDMRAFGSGPSPSGETPASDATAPSLGETDAKPVDAAVATPPTATVPVPPLRPRDENDVFGRLREAQRRRAPHPAPAGELTKPAYGPGTHKPDIEGQ